MARRSKVQRYMYIAFAIIILILSWESSLSNTALAQSTIPEESIRLRILANSDGARDQWIKREIRDKIVHHMNQWVQGPKTISEARAEVEARLADFDRIVGETLRNNGFEYTYSVELGVVHFPAKLYGNQLYPAGEYEALRVTLGQGQGQNWWCVLFPPLCFVDLASGEAVTREEFNDAQISEGNESISDNEKEVRFFLWDMIKNIIEFIKGMFI